MAGRKQHFIQRLLLKGFAHDPQREPSHVWVYRFDGNVFNSALEGYGAERDFYGHPDESDLDARITDLESNRFNELLEGLRQGLDRTVSAVDAASLIVHVIARSKNLRSTMTAGVRPLVTRCIRMLRSEDHLEKLLIAAMRADPATLLEKLGKTGLRPDECSVLAKRLAPLLPALAKEFIRQQSHVIDAFLSTFQAKVAELVAEGHRQTLHARLTDFTGTRVTQLREINWRRKTLSADLILGDSVVFVELEDGTFKPMTEPGDVVAHVWLPLSSRMVLVGSPTSHEPQIDSLRVNLGSASCSYDGFCAAAGPDAYRSLVPRIRTAVFKLNDADVERISNDAVARLIA